MVEKRKKFYFDYKGFVAIDEENEYIQKVHVTPANISEVNQLDTLIEGEKGKRIYGD